MAMKSSKETLNKVKENANDPNISKISETTNAIASTLSKQSNAIQQLKNSISKLESSNDDANKKVASSLQECNRTQLSINSTLKSINTAVTSLTKVMTNSVTNNTAVSLLGSIQTSLMQITSVLSAFRSDFILSANGQPLKGYGYYDMNEINNVVNSLRSIKNKELQLQLTAMYKASNYANKSSNKIRGMIGNSNLDTSDDKENIIDKMMGKIQQGAQFASILQLIPGKIGQTAKKKISGMDLNNGLAGLLGSLMSDRNKANILNPLNELSMDLQDSNGPISKMLGGLLNKAGFKKDKKQREKDPNLVMSSLAPFADDIKDLVKHSYQSLKVRPKNSTIPLYATPVWVVNSKDQTNYIDSNAKTMGDDLTANRIMEVLEGRANNTKDEYGNDLLRRENGIWKGSLAEGRNRKTLDHASSRAAQNVYNRNHERYGYRETDSEGNYIGDIKYDDSGAAKAIKNLNDTLTGEGGSGLLGMLPNFRYARGEGFNNLMIALQAVQENGLGDGVANGLKTIKNSAKAIGNIVKESVGRGNGTTQITNASNNSLDTGTFDMYSNLENGPTGESTVNPTPTVNNDSNNSSTVNPIPTPTVNNDSNDSSTVNPVPTDTTGSNPTRNEETTEKQITTIGQDSTTVVNANDVRKFKSNKDILKGQLLIAGGINAMVDMLIQENIYLSQAVNTKKINPKEAKNYKSSFDTLENLITTMQVDNDVVSAIDGFKKASDLSSMIKPPSKEDLTTSEYFGTDDNEEEGNGNKKHSLKNLLKSIKENGIKGLITSGINKAKNKALNALKKTKKFKAAKNVAGKIKNKLKDKIKNKLADHGITKSNTKDAFKNSFTNLKDKIKNNEKLNSVIGKAKNSKLTGKIKNSKLGKKASEALKKVKKMYNDELTSLDGENAEEISQAQKEAEETVNTANQTAKEETTRKKILAKAEETAAKAREKAKAAFDKILEKFKKKSQDKEISAEEAANQSIMATEAASAETQIAIDNAAAAGESGFNIKSAIKNALTKVSALPKIAKIGLAALGIKFIISSGAKLIKSIKNASSKKKNNSGFEKMDDANASYADKETEKERKKEEKALKKEKKEARKKRKRRNRLNRATFGLTAARVYIDSSGNVLKTKGNEPVYKLDEDGNETDEPLNIKDSDDKKQFIKRLIQREFKMDKGKLLIKKLKKGISVGKKVYGKIKETDDKVIDGVKTVGKKTLGFAGKIINGTKDIIESQKYKLNNLLLMSSSAFLFMDSKLTKMLDNIENSDFGRKIQEQPEKATSTLFNVVAGGFKTLVTKVKDKAKDKIENNGIVKLAKSLIKKVKGEDDTDKKYSSDLSDGSFSESGTVAYSQMVQNNIRNGILNSFANTLGVGKAIQMENGNIYTTSKIVDEQRKNNAIKLGVVGGEMSSAANTTASSAIVGGTNGGTLSTVIPYNKYGIWKQGNWNSDTGLCEGWSTKTCIGIDGDTLEDGGCSLTSIAMMLVHAGVITDPTFNPGTFADDINSRSECAGPCGGTNPMSNMPHYKGENIMEAVDGGIAKTYSSYEAIYNAVVDSMKQGYFLVGWVYNHYVAIDYVDTSKKVIYIMDPGYNGVNCWYDENHPESIAEGDSGYTMVSGPKDKYIKGIVRYKSSTSNASVYLLNGRRSFDSAHPNGGAPNATITNDNTSASTAVANNVTSGVTKALTTSVEEDAAAKKKTKTGTGRIVKHRNNIRREPKYAQGRVNNYINNYKNIDPTHIYQRDYSNYLFNTSNDTEMQTLADSGCGPAAAAVVKSAYGRGKYKFGRRRYYYGKADKEEDNDTKDNKKKTSSSSKKDNDTSKAEASENQSTVDVLGKTVSDGDYSVTIEPIHITIFKALKEAGCNDEVACGVMGNIHRETGGTQESIEYCATHQGVDSNGLLAGGLVQWNPWTKHVEWSSQNGFSDPTSIDSQIAHVIADMTNDDTMMWSRGKNSNISSEGYTECNSVAEFMALTDVADAAVNYERAYEGSGDWSLNKDSIRVSLAKCYYGCFKGIMPNQLSSSSSSSSSLTGTVSGNIGLTGYLNLITDNAVGGDSLSDYLANSTLYNDGSNNDDNSSSSSSSSSSKSVSKDTADSATNAVANAVSNAVKKSSGSGRRHSRFGRGSDAVGFKNAHFVATNGNDTTSNSSLASDNSTNNSNKSSSSASSSKATSNNNNSNSSLTNSSPSSESYIKNNMTIKDTDNNGNTKTTTNVYTENNKTTLTTNGKSTIVICNNFAEKTKTDLSDVLSNFKRLNGTQNNALKVLKAISDLIKEDDSEENILLRLNNDGLDYILKGL